MRDTAGVRTPVDPCSFHPARLTLHIACHSYINEITASTLISDECLFTQPLLHGEQVLRGYAFRLAGVCVSCRPKNRCNNYFIREPHFRKFLRRSAFKMCLVRLSGGISPGGLFRSLSERSCGPVGDKRPRVAKGSCGRRKSQSGRLAAPPDRFGNAGPAARFLGHPPAPISDRLSGACRR